VILGLDGKDTVLLLLTLVVGVVNVSSRRSNFVQGLVHLVLFLTYVVLIFDQVANRGLVPCVSRCC